MARLITSYRGETLTLAATGSIGFAQVRNIPPGMNVLEVHPVSATIEALLLAFGPKILRVFLHRPATSTALARFIDLTDALVDRNTASLSPLSGMASTDFLYVCLAQSARGLAVDVSDANAIAAVATWSYLDVADTWTSLSATDGTASGGATLAVDGLVTWTVPNPALWVSRELPVSLGAPFPARGYWLRLTVDATLTLPTTLGELSALANINVDTLTARSEGQARVRIPSHNSTRAPDRFPLSAEYGSVEITSTTIVTAIYLNWYHEI